MARPTQRARTLSQNFLADRATAERVARLAAPDTRRPPLLLEVGAGKGALTGPLARRSRELHAYEIDPRLLPGLRARFAHAPHVRVVGGDFLAARPPRAPFSLAGNVPFSRTADIVDWCLAAPALTDATLITQLEYARKRTGDYGRWTLLTIRSWPDHEWRLAGRVGRYRFRPAPRVDAGILRLERRSAPLLTGAARRSWDDLVELGFSGVGGSLHASLRRARPARRVDAAFRAARLDPRALVGEVPPGAWLRLHRELAA
ncbi:23S rRNA (adenine(2058)-N(6))-methyltransferase Erm(O) [Streptomyces parvulus]|uniref:23S rRNA (Adenine(2058)-N(6))-methyltransferase Erm(O) n=1 Tax=Streptomyces parvulus TaxID=146923 RepID=A0A191V570_9ACTN|nr:23S rRNA (adenine(2058)-N(6))-methyltransferase Erm(O) [Streptomyces parvulus]ANJ10070.1 ErmE/ErmH/ErmO/ErmR family 23S rRNA (adenine(2058)-N(6))-methyltransferase [Streptomyces parvulus]MCC9154073.1 23S rRNA (adenine(2058)-N(6))-methyltransferase Erm(O) [Streptomyces parvulus]MCE7689103.1 23S rRNA (adenine(2058)-N(6))-methyltransferase Erm(O) [Streptomyces parvulus]GGR87438.1 23S rRNA (adenine(2058)-N(6))-methyltransferase Erm(O) [Streptomyces parvulus]